MMIITYVCKAKHPLLSLNSLCCDSSDLASDLAEGSGLWLASDSCEGDVGHTWWSFALH